MIKTKNARMDGRGQEKWWKKNKSVGQICKMYRKTEKVCRLQSSLLQKKKRTLCEVGGEKGANCFSPQEEKSLLGLWPTSLSLSAMEKLKDREMDGWREEMEAWGGGRSPSFTEQNDWNSRWDPDCLIGRREAGGIRRWTIFAITENSQLLI